MYYTDRDLAEKFGCSRHTIWRWVRENYADFPKPIRLGPQVTRWRIDEIEAWEKAKAEARRA